MTPPEDHDPILQAIISNGANRGRSLGAAMTFRWMRSTATCRHEGRTRGGMTNRPKSPSSTSCGWLNCKCRRASGQSTTCCR